VALEDYAQVGANLLFDVIFTLSRLLAYCPPRQHPFNQKRDSAEKCFFERPQTTHNTNTSSSFFHASEKEEYTKEFFRETVIIALTYSVK
jgi:hypothetical protein